jgi:hypothetical protein
MKGENAQMSENIIDYVDEIKTEVFTENVNELTILQIKVADMLEELGRKHFSTCCLDRGVGVTVWHGDEKSKVLVRVNDSEKYILKKLMEV